MDQGSPSETLRSKIRLPAFDLPVAPESGGKHLHEIRVILDAGVPCCIICGRTGRFVDPFPRRR